MMKTLWIGLIKW